MTNEEKLIASERSRLNDSMRRVDDPLSRREELRKQCRNVSFHQKQCRVLREWMEDHHNMAGYSYWDEYTDDKSEVAATKE